MNHTYHGPQAQRTYHNIMRGYYRNNDVEAGTMCGQISTERRAHSNILMKMMQARGENMAASKRGKAPLLNKVEGASTGITARRAIATRARRVDGGRWQ